MNQECAPLIFETLIIISLLNHSGPWKQIQKYKADSIGPEDLNEPSESQDFRGFYETSRVRTYTSILIHYCEQCLNY